MIDVYDSVISAVAVCIMCFGLILLLFALYINYLQMKIKGMLVNTKRELSEQYDELMYGNRSKFQQAQSLKETAAKRLAEILYSKYDQACLALIGSDFGKYESLSKAFVPKSGSTIDKMVHLLRLFREHFHETARGRVIVKGFDKVNVRFFAKKNAVIQQQLLDYALFSVWYLEAASVLLTYLADQQAVEAASLESGDSDESSADSNLIELSDESSIEHKEEDSLF